MGGLAPPPPEVIAAERAIAAYLDPTALREALTRWYDPGWRVVVVGRVSADMTV